MVERVSYFYAMTPSKFKSAAGARFIPREEEYRLLVESVQDCAIFFIDPWGSVASWNPGAERIKGYQAEEIIGRSFEIFYPPEERSRARSLLQAASRDGRVVDQGWRVRKNGERFWADVIITALRGSDGALKGFAKVTRDSDARKRSEEAARAQTSELRRSNEDLSQFAAVAAHDLQSPLRKINAFGDILERRLAGTIDAESADALARMRRSAEYLSELVRDLLQLSRIGEDERIEADVALGPIVEAVLGDLEEAISGAGVRVFVGELPSVRGDRSQLYRLLLNLVSNAVKFRREGATPRVRITGGFCARERLLVLEIRDNGIGFDARDAERIRRPFERLHGRDKFEGSGIGLAICDKIVLRMGGKMTLRGHPGRGARVRVLFPDGAGGSR